MKVVVRLASGLRTHAGGVACVEVELAGPVTVSAVIDAVETDHPAIGRRIRDEAGELRRHVNIFVGSDNARDLDGMETVVTEGIEVAVLPAVSGGCGEPTRRDPVHRAYGR